MVYMFYYINCMYQFVKMRRKNPTQDNSLDINHTMDYLFHQDIQHYGIGMYIHMHITCWIQLIALKSQICTHDIFIRTRLKYSYVCSKRNVASGCTHMKENCALCIFIKGLLIQPT